MSAPREGWWCWQPDDPEMTYPDTSDWVHEIFLGDAPIMQRFDWGQPAPSSWVVVYYDEEDDRIVKEFDDEAEADAFFKQVSA